MTIVGIAMIGFAMPADAATDGQPTPSPIATPSTDGSTSSTTDATQAGSDSSTPSTSGQSGSTDPTQPPADDSTGSSDGSSAGTPATGDPTTSTPSTGSGSAGNTGGATTPSTSAPTDITQSPQSLTTQGESGGFHTDAAVDCGQHQGQGCLTLIKNVIGGSAHPNDWTFTANGHRGLDDYHFTSGDTLPVDDTHGNEYYELEESGGPGNYTQTGITCVGGDYDADDNELTLDAGDGVTCTFTNVYVESNHAVIVVDAGGLRTGDSSVGPLPDGAVFQAVADPDDNPSWNDPPSGTYTCTVANGICIITVPTEGRYFDGFYWDVSEETPPSGWYLNTELGTGGSGSSQHDYVFETDELSSGDTYTVTTSGDYSDNSEGWVDESGQSFGSKLATSIDDPTPQQKCGLNIALVLDQSGSMEGTKQTNLKKAANDVVDGLTGTPSRLAMYTFGSNANNQGHIDLTSTATTQSAQHLHDFVNGLPTDLNDATNWDRGLGQIIDEAQNHDFDLVIFLTDGAPTVFGSDDGYGNSTTFRYVDEGIYSANAIKATGTPLIGVGVGLPTGAEVNLRAVSGQTEGTDYYTENSSTFVDRLIDLATGACKNSVTVQKQIEDPDGNIIDNSPDSNGWDFTGSITGNGNSIGDFDPTAEVNGNNGFTNADVTIASGSSPTISLTESQQSGYTLADVTCKVGGESVHVDIDDTTASFTGQPGETTSCVFTNRQEATSITVDKTWTVEDSNGNVIATYNLPGDENNLPAGLDATPTVAGVPASWGEPVTGPAGGQTVAISETASIDPAKLPGCTLDSQLLTNANGTVLDPGKALPYDAVLATGANTYTITNTVTCAQTLTLVKDVSYGSASPTAWTLSAQPPNGSSALPGFSGQTGVSGPVSTGVGYTLDEADGPATYIPTKAGWTCTTDQDDPVKPVDGAVTVPLGQNVTCTITNTTAKLTLFKHTGSDTLKPGWFDLTDTPASGQSGLTPDTVAGVDGTPGGNDSASTVEVRPDYDYTLTEALNSGHDGVPYLATALQKWDPNAGGGQGAWVDVTGNTVQVDPGAHAYYRFVNASVPAITLPLTGGVGTDLFLILGGLAILAALGAGLWYGYRRRTTRVGGV